MATAKASPAIRLADYRAPDFEIEETYLEFSLDSERVSVRSRLKLTPLGAPPEEKLSLRLDGAGLAPLCVRIDGVALSSDTFRASDAGIVIDAVPAASFTLEIETVSFPASNSTFTGLFLLNGIYCTQCEPEGFRHLTYYLDRPDAHSKFTVRIEAPLDLTPVLLSNGNLIAKGVLGGEGPREARRHFAVWNDPFAKPAYLFAMVAGRLSALSDRWITRSGRTIAINLYAMPGREERGRWALRSLKLAMAWDEQRFGLEYDLDVYNIVAMPDFNGGAMENKGLNIFNETFILVDEATATDDDLERVEMAIAHEYFHNWTGNRVTCRDWFQIGLKEGLTVFRHQEFMMERRGRAAKRIDDVNIILSTQAREEAGARAHAIRPRSYRSPNEVFSTTAYYKSAEVFRMLEGFVGRDGFTAGLQLFLRRHDGHGATLEDFLAAVEEASGLNLQPYIGWFDRVGPTAVSVDFERLEEPSTARLTLRQQAPGGQDGAHSPPLPVCVKLGFVARDGHDIAIRAGHHRAWRPDDAIFVLSEPHDCFEVEDLPEAAIPSLMRDYSAPVKLTTSLDDEQRIALLRLDTDLVGRWLCAREIWLEIIVGAISQRDQERREALHRGFVGALGETVCNYTIAPAVRAAIATPPGENEIALALGSDIDPEAVHTERRKAAARVASDLLPALEEVYAREEPRSRDIADVAAVAQRKVRKAMLALICLADMAVAPARLKAIFAASASMTERITALSMLAQFNLSESKSCLEEFRRDYGHEPALLNKWFTIQAQSPAPETPDLVAELSESPDFDYASPNRVRALFSAFADSNPVRFNDLSGRGYHVVAAAIRAIDTTNPKSAARLAASFQSWRTLEPRRRELAKRAMQTLADTKLSAASRAQIERLLAGTDRAAR